MYNLRRISRRYAILLITTIELLISVQFAIDQVHAVALDSLWHYPVFTIVFEYIMPLLFLPILLCALIWSRGLPANRRKYVCAQLVVFMVMACLELQASLQLAPPLTFLTWLSIAMVALQVIQARSKRARKHMDATR